MLLGVAHVKSLSAHSSFVQNRLVQPENSNHYERDFQSLAKDVTKYSQDSIFRLGEPEKHLSGRATNQKESRSAIAGEVPTNQQHHSRKLVFSTFGV